MGLDIYKPNSKNTGHAARFSFNSKDGALYINFIKQVNYDANKRIGSFKGGETASIKLGIWEAGSIIDALNTKKEFKTVHKSPQKTVSISVGPYFATDDPQKLLGYSFSISYKDEKDVQKRFSISLTPGEKTAFIEYLRFFLDHCFTAIYSAEKEYFKNKNKAPRREELPTLNVEPADSSDSEQLVDPTVEDIF